MLLKLEKYVKDAVFYFNLWYIPVEMFLAWYVERQICNWWKEEMVRSDEHKKHSRRLTLDLKRQQLLCSTNHLELYQECWLSIRQLQCDKNSTFSSNLIRVIIKPFSVSRVHIDMALGCENESINLIIFEHWLLVSVVFFNHWSIPLQLTTSLTLPVFSSHIFLGGVKIVCKKLFAVKLGFFKQVVIFNI